MFCLNVTMRYYLCPGRTDMRKGINSLVGVVKQQMECDVRNGDGRLNIDNNLAENEIRPVTLGRKNYLFCGNHEAAENMCVIISLLSTSRNHGVNPRAYLNDIIARMPYMNKATHEELVELLPHSWKLPHEDAVMTKDGGR